MSVHTLVPARAATPTFIDLRAFADAADLDGVPVDGGSLPATRALLDLGEDAPVTAGAARLRAGQGEERQDMNEYVLVTAGTLSLTHGGRTLVLGPGDSAVLPQATSFAWMADGEVRFIFMTYRGGAGAANGPIRVDRGAALLPSNPPSAALLTTPTPQCRSHSDYKSADGEWMVGTWDSTPYTRHAMTYPHYELMHIVDGAVSIADEGGRAATFAADTVFLVPRGASCTWSNTEHVRKVYVIHRPVVP